MIRGWGRAALAVLAISAVAVPAALAGEGERRQNAELDFTTQRAGSSTGVSTDILYFNPNDRSRKPFAVDRIVTKFHPGTKIDTSVPRRCDLARASAPGDDACPPGSKVGGGFIQLDRGEDAPPRIGPAGVLAPRLLKFDAELFNTEDGIIFRLEGRNNPFTFTNQGRVGERTIEVDVPPLPGGEPDNQTALDIIDLRMGEISNRRGNYITTPRSCPRSGRWVNRATFKYDANQDRRFEVVQTELSRSPCRGGGGSEGRSFSGTSRNDVITGTSGNDRIVCGGGNDRVDAGGGDDVVICGSGNDVVRGGPGNDRLAGGSGDDRLFGEAGQDRLDGGSGTDLLVQ